jgi:hypothetical protein
VCLFGGVRLLYGDVILCGLPFLLACAYCSVFLVPVVMFTGLSSECSIGFFSTGVLCRCVREMANVRGVCVLVGSNKIFDL